MRLSQRCCAPLWQAWVVMSPTSSKKLRSLCRTTSSYKYFVRTVETVGAERSQQSRDRMPKEMSDCQLPLYGTAKLRTIASWTSLPLGELRARRTLISLLGPLRTVIPSTFARA